MEPAISREVAELTREARAYGCLHWLDQPEHGIWFRATAPRLMALERRGDGRVEIVTFVATDFVDRRMDGIAAQVYAPEDFPEDLLGLWWDRAV